MEATGGKRGQKRVNLPSTPQQRVVDLTVALLSEKCGATFGKGFRLKGIGQRLYVQVTGRKIPLHLDFEAGPDAVQKRAWELKSYLGKQSEGFDSDAWRDACAVERVRKGKSGHSRLDLDGVVARWKRLKLAEGIAETTFHRHHLPILRKLDPERPLSEESLLGAIEATRPGTLARRRLIPFLRKVCKVCGGEWPAQLLDPLQAAVKVSSRDQPFFPDEEVIRIATHPSIPSPWRRVVVAMAIYGLRPWEAWIVEPCNRRPGCAWVGEGKTNNRGTTKPRQVPPFHPEWVHDFGMDELWKQSLPRRAEKSRSGWSVNQRLRQLGVLPPGSSTAYGFRHAYARRLHSPRYRVTDTHAALFMGHTVAVHNQVYREWLGGEDPIAMYFD